MINGVGSLTICLGHYSPDYHPPSSPSNDSEETFHSIRTWFQECDKRHPSCQPHQPDWRPTRLLYINGDPSKVFLVRGENMRRNERYISVSHRWGISGSIPRLTSERLAGFRRGLRLKSLPKSFRDCILVARRLGVGYIWIDSLCIIQSGDDGRDWLQESSQMNHVYRNAYCNLMVSWASSSESIFATREPRVFDRLSIELPIKQTGAEGPTTSLSFLSVESELWATEVSDSPLNRRAWVTQERFLSRRNIHFARQEVFWECAERAHCESVSDLRFSVSRGGGDTDDSHIKAPHWKLPDRHKASADRYSSADCSPSQLAGYLRWEDIVRVYTRAELTFPSDKLVALGGLARHMKALLDDTYIAGLWLRHLHGNLLWHAGRDSEGTVMRPHFSTPSCPHADVREQYRAPSFSWASTDDAMSSGELTIPERVLVEICCVKYRPSHIITQAESWKDEPIVDDLFGPFTEPVVELRVTGRVFPAMLEKQPKYDCA
ncbi:heterokaryon incompatibility protein-domain-containing protein [Cercophora newfieldiana]|uniref:Heterokaryon incompatibility protein-domain-containing protein n=1 Tax=Cercophora newfieldiana TaxID=92897 RepID=A0AA39Y6V4_9PEZI|nr:heterokaryon incompatibility protein-domain-containing protein [Cercophora newfieldiana]